jgi:hypothetical protein
MDLAKGIHEGTGTKLCPSGFSRIPALFRYATFFIGEMATMMMQRIQAPCSNVIAI